MEDGVALVVVLQGGGRDLQRAKTNVVKVGLLVLDKPAALLQSLDDIERCGFVQVQPFADIGDPHTEALFGHNFQNVDRAHY
ncbi:hypothetical protein SDC9_90700 [bioreactor metagenome]|uniref:Uncharacterized protein n=1 Tax=bioreactor metagenome TaxID=1076179 RepID=A0A644ZT36_9ZZZZ